MSAVVRLIIPKGRSSAELEIPGTPYEAERRYTVTAAGEQDIPHAGNKRPLGNHSIEALRTYVRRHRGSSRRSHTQNWSSFSDDPFFLVPAFRYGDSCRVAGNPP